MKATSIFAIAILALATALPAFGQDLKPSPETCLMRVNSTLQSYSFLRPWEKGAPTPRRGLGAILKGNRVLTTAELTVNSTYIELEHPTSGRKVPAKIVGRDYEANLALLAPANDDMSVFEGTVPVEIDESVEGGDTLEVWQIEDNGDGVTTSVEVLRASVGRYFVDRSVLLIYEVKGSLQARANSFTLPIFKDNKYVGSLLSYNSKEQTAAVLPAPVIKKFLADLEDGDYAGFPNIGLSYSQMLDEQLRKFSGVADKEGGVYIRSARKDGSAGKSGIEKGDVLLAINDHPIDSRGNYVHKKYGKINFSHIVRGEANVGDTLKFHIVRDGKEKTIDVKLERKLPTDYLIDPYMFDRGPKYVIFGGLIFQELTLPYLQSWGGKWSTQAPFKLVHANSSPKKYEDEGREKLVFLSNVLKTPATLGYESLGGVILNKVNGKEIKNINDLSKALAEAPENKVHRIEFDGFPEVIFVHDDVSRQINQQLIQYGISELERLK